MIQDFEPLPGLTRRETMDRELIRLALSLSRWRTRHGSTCARRSTLAAAEYLGVSQCTVYNRLRHFEKRGQPLPLAIKPTRQFKPTRKWHPPATWLLRKFGIDITRGSLWNRDDLQAVLCDARKRWLEIQKREHPDRGGNAAVSAVTNEWWRLLRRIFARRGYETK